MEVGSARGQGVEVGDGRRRRGRKGEMTLGVRSGWSSPAVVFSQKKEDVLEKSSPQNQSIIRSGNSPPLPPFLVLSPAKHL